MAWSKFLAASNPIGFTSRADARSAPKKSAPVTAIYGSSGGPKAPVIPTGTSCSRNLHRNLRKLRFQNLRFLQKNLRFLQKNLRMLR